MEEKKPMHAKPSYYAIMFEPLKEIALKYGYNLVLHGSLNRDMDLIAIPWNEEVGNVSNMMNEFCDYVGGRMHQFNRRADGSFKEFTKKPHGRMAYVIDIYRGGYFDGDIHFHHLTYHEDPQTYIDISVVPSFKTFE